MKGREGSGGEGHGAAGGASLSRGGGDGHDRGDHGRDGEGKLRIHLKRSCTDKKLVQGETGLGLTTDGEDISAGSSIFVHYVLEELVLGRAVGAGQARSLGQVSWICADVIQVTPPPSRQQCLNCTA